MVTMNTILEIFKSKKVRYGGYAAVVTLAVLVGLVIVNLIVQQIPAEADMTHNKLYSLSAQTKTLAKGLTGDVTIYALYRTGQENQDVVDVLTKYQRLTGKIHVVYVDPDKNPGLVSKYNANNKGIPEGSLIITSGDYTRVLNPYDLYDISYSEQGQPQVMGFTAEQKITGALAYVSSGKTPVLYELTGDGEDTLETLQLAETLQQSNYAIKTLNLLTDPSVPSDASAVVVLSPKFDLSKDEESKLLDYIENHDGRALFFFDLTNKPLSGFNDLLSSFGVALQYGLVVESDKSHFVGNPLMIIPALGTSDILKGVTGSNLTMIVPQSMAVKTLEVRRRDLEIKPLLTSSSNSFVRVDLSNGVPTRIASDIPGPANLADSIEEGPTSDKPNGGFRLVVGGSGQFLGSIFPYGTIKGNVEFFLGAVQWVTSQPNSINIESKSLYQLPLQMSALLIYVFMAIVVILIPGVILAVGLVTWLRRRHL